jgi:hypothetical protein
MHTSAEKLLDHQRIVECDVGIPRLPAVAFCP